MHENLDQKNRTRTFGESCAKLYDLEDPKIEYVELPPYDGSLVKIPIKKGYGETVKPGSKVNINYKSFFNDPPYTLFEDSYAGGSCVEFRLGEKTVFPCWETLILTMCKSEQAELIAAPEHAFGPEGMEGLVPPNTTIRFFIELVDFSVTDTRDFQEKFEDFKTYFNKGKEHFENKEYDIALDLFFKSLEISKSTWGEDDDTENEVKGLRRELFMNISKVFIQQKKYRSSIAILKKGLAENLKDLEMKKALGDSYYMNQRYEEARNIYNIISNEHPDREDFITALNDAEREVKMLKAKQNLLYRNIITKGLFQSS